MSDSNSLMNIGDLAKPATTLIEKISDATGAICQPWQMKRIAKAEIEINKLKALGDAEVSEIQKRAMQRLLAEETKKQENIENVTAKALPEIKESAKPEEIDNDWLSNFFDKSKLVSDEEMQSLWAKVLAGEANKPGNFSKRTVDIVSSLDKSDAELFTKLCEFCVSKTTPLIFEPNNPLYRTKGISFKSLNDLDAIGLIKFNSIGYTLNGLDSPLTFRYFDTSITIKSAENSKGSIETGTVMLTKSGFQLALICEAQQSDDFLVYIQKYWKEKGHDVTVDKVIVNNYFSVTVESSENNIEEKQSEVINTLNKLFHPKNIQIRHTEKNRFQIDVFVLTPTNEWTVRDGFDELENLTKTKVTGYSFN